MNKKWSNSEINILNERYSNTSKYYLLELLPNRSWSSILQKAKILKLNRNKKFRNYYWNHDICFWNFVNKNSGKFYNNSECWEWTGNLNHEGYGRYTVETCTRIRAHRYSYELIIGKIPQNKVLDHLCRNRKCVNPDHLECVSNKENILRGESPYAKKARQTHCINGHKLTTDNVYIRPDNYTRQCKICRKNNKLRYENKN